MSGNNSVPIWITIILSSALISALVNVAFSALSKWWDHRREDAKEKERTAHIYLEIAMQLERWARQAGNEMNNIYQGLWAYKREQDESLLQSLDVLTFVFDPEPVWTQLPVNFAATAFPVQLSNCREWISHAADTWADVADAWEQHRQRLAFYGRKACALAVELRHDLGVRQDAATIGLTDYFQKEIDQWQTVARELAKVDDPFSFGANLIPELVMESSGHQAPSKRLKFKAYVLRRFGYTK